jgi:hypothetical protein
VRSVVGLGRPDDGDRESLERVLMLRRGGSLRRRGCGLGEQVEERVPGAPGAVLPHVIGQDREPGGLRQESLELLEESSVGLRRRLSVAEYVFDHLPGGLNTL